MTFTEQWFPESSQDVLAGLARTIADLPGMIIEIGSWEGRSTVALANAAHPRIVHAVDTWQGSPGEISADLAAEPGRDVFATWRANVDELTAGNVTPHRMGWREYVPTIDEPIALAFIDAEHTYVEVRDNVAALLPLIAPGGIICGDDAHHQPVAEAVLEVLAPLGEVYHLATLWIWQAPSGTLAGEYARLCVTPSDIYLHLPRLVALVQATNDRTGEPVEVLELGSRSGLSTIAWLYALGHTGGHLTSVDLDGPPAIGDHEQWTFIQGDDMDPDLIARLQPADIVFIDTSHHYGHTLDELRTYRRLVKPGGLIVCHDTELEVPTDPPAPAGDPPWPVKRAIEEFVAETGFKWVNVPECWGLGVIKVEA